MDFSDKNNTYQRSTSASQTTELSLEPLDEVGMSKVFRDTDTYKSGGGGLFVENRDNEYKEVESGVETNEECRDNIVFWS